MSKEWEEIDHDEVSGRRIFSREVEPVSSGYNGTYDFDIAKDLQVRNADGEVLLQKHGSASGEYWCGVFMFFVKGSEGKKVRVEESDREEDEFFDVPDTPLPEDKIWK